MVVKGWRPGIGAAADADYRGFEELPTFWMLHLAEVPESDRSNASDECGAEAAKATSMQRCPWPAIQSPTCDNFLDKPVIPSGSEAMSAQRSRRPNAAESFTR